METKSQPNPGTSTTETSTPSPAPSGPKPREPKKGGRSKKQASADEKAPLTVSVKPAFLKKLRIVSQGLDQSVSDYIESRLTTVLNKDFKQVLEDMA